MNAIKTEQHKNFIDLIETQHINAIYDNRFFVVNEKLIDLTTYDYDGNLYAVITTYDASGVYNASDANDLKDSFKRENLTDFALYVGDDAEQRAEIELIKLFTQALK